MLPAQKLQVFFTSLCLQSGRNCNTGKCKPHGSGRIFLYARQVEQLIVFRHIQVAFPEALPVSVAGSLKLYLDNAGRRVLDGILVVARE